MKILTEDVYNKNVILFRDADSDTDAYSFVLITNKNTQDIKKIVQDVKAQYPEDWTFEDIEDALPGEVYGLDDIIEL